MTPGEPLTLIVVLCDEVMIRSFLYVPAALISSICFCKMLRNCFDADALDTKCRFPPVIVEMDSVGKCHFFISQKIIKLILIIHWRDV